MWHWSAVLERSPMKCNSSQFSNFPDQNIIIKTKNNFIKVKVKYCGLFSTEGLFLEVMTSQFGCVDCLQAWQTNSNIHLTGWTQQQRRRCYPLICLIIWFDDLFFLKESQKKTFLYEKMYTMNGIFYIS